MAEFVKDYVSKCLPCARFRPAQRRSFRGVLEKPGAFQLVSLDCIGPMNWHGVKRWVLVIICHASRFMATEVF